MKTVAGYLTDFALEARIKPWSLLNALRVVREANPDLWEGRPRGRTKGPPSWSTRQKCNLLLVCAAIEADDPAKMVEAVRSLVWDKRSTMVEVVLGEGVSLPPADIEQDGFFLSNTTLAAALEAVVVAVQGMSPERLAALREYDLSLVVSADAQLGEIRWKARGPSGLFHNREIYVAPQRGLLDPQDPWAVPPVRRETFISFKVIEAAARLGADAQGANGDLPLSHLAAALAAPDRENAAPGRAASTRTQDRSAPAHTDGQTGTTCTPEAKRTRVSSQASSESRIGPSPSTHGEGPPPDEHPGPYPPRFAAA